MTMHYSPVSLALASLLLVASGLKVPGNVSRTQSHPMEEIKARYDDMEVEDGGYQAGSGVVSGENRTKREIRRVMQMNPPIRPGDSVFGLGCGFGRELQSFRMFLGVGKVGGIDLSDGFINRAKKDIFPNPEDAKNFRAGDVAAHMDEGKWGTWDHVVSLGVIGHLADEAAAKNMVSNAMRLLKPGGSMVICGINGPDSQKDPGYQKYAEKIHYTLKLPVSFWEKCGVEMGFQITCVEEYKKMPAMHVPMDFDKLTGRYCVSANKVIPGAAPKPLCQSPARLDRWQPVSGQAQGSSA